MRYGGGVEKWRVRVVSLAPNPLYRLVLGSLGGRRGWSLNNARNFFVIIFGRKELSGDGGHGPGGGNSSAGSQSCVGLESPGSVVLSVDGLGK
jgi:hypothetical protein